MFIHIPATSGHKQLPCRGLDAHVDTVKVPVGAQITPVVDGDTITSDGTTILGADDKAGITAILEALMLLQEGNIPHGPIQVIFSVGEETSQYGVRQLNPDDLKAESMVCVESFTPGDIICACAGKIKYRATFVGRACHAMTPERGINALLVANHAVDLLLRSNLFGEPGSRGLIPGDTSDQDLHHNLSQVTGGDKFPNTNVVPETAVVCGELRSRSKDRLEWGLQQVQEAFDLAAAYWRSADNQHQASVEMEVERPYDPYLLPENHPLVRELEDAMIQAGPTPHVIASPGACHANVYSQHLPVVVIGAGGENCHSVDEYVQVSDMCLAAQTITHWLAAA